MLDPGNYTFSIFAIPMAVTTIAVVVLGLAVLARERVSLVSFAFALLTMSLAVWFFSYTFVYSSTNPDTALSWVRVSLVGVCLLPPATFTFTVTALQLYDRYKYLVWLNWLMGISLALVSAFTDAMDTGLYQYWWGYYTRFSWAGSLFLVFIAGILAADLVLFANAYSAAGPGVRKQRIRSFLSAFLVSYIGVVDLFATIGIPVYPFGYIPILGFVAILAYTIWRYHLVDITPAFAAPQIIETMAGGLLVLDSEGVIRLVNSAAVELFGRGKDELIDKPVRDLLNEPLFDSALGKTGETGGFHDCVVSYTHPERGSRVLSLSASVVQQVGTPEAVVCVANDITQQQQVEEQLRVQNEYMSALHETSLDLMNRLDLAELLEDIISRAASLANTEHGYIYLLSPDDEDDLVVHTGLGIFGKNVGASLRRGQGLAGRVLQTGRPMAVDDYSLWMGHDERYHSAGFHATVGVPLTSGSQVVGVIGLAYTEPTRKFGAADIELLSRFAQLASIALDNARLYSAAQQELADRRVAEEQVRLLNAELEVRVLQRTSQLADANRVLESEVFERKRAEEERTRLLEREQHRARQLRQLADASISINSARSLDDMLRVVTAQARLIIGAHQAMMTLAVGPIKTGSRMEKVSDLGVSNTDCSGVQNITSVGAMASEPGLEALVRDSGAPVCLSASALAMHPAANGAASGRAVSDCPPLRGWLAAPLTRADGRYLGLIQLSDKAEGEFTEQDEAILVQLAQVTSIAVENARLYREAQEAVAAREGLLSIVSHDLGNPLSVVKGSTRLLRRKLLNTEPPLPETFMPGLDRIENATDRMTNLINELLDFARVQAGQQLNLEFHVTDMVALAKQAVAGYEASTDRHILRFETAVPSMYGVWDTSRLERMLDNLLSNAIKYSPMGGEIQVSVDRKEGATGHAGWAVLRVKDEGLGIPAEEVPHIFEWFHRAQNTAGRVSGTGIGLASARQVIEQHGGTISVTSREGEGSMFTVHLPLTKFEDIDVAKADS